MTSRPPIAKDLYSVDRPRFVLRMVVYGEVQQAAVVPHDQIAWIPDVSRLEFRAYRMAVKIVEQRLALLA